VSALPPGQYRVTAQRYVRGETTIDAYPEADPGDLLDIAKNRNQQPIMVTLPVTTIGGLAIPIECLTRREIFR
jgi:hypothetical protein